MQEWEMAVKVAGGQGMAGSGCALTPTGEPKDTGTPRMVLGKLSHNFPTATRAPGQIKLRSCMDLSWLLPGVHIPGGKCREDHHQGSAGTPSTSTGWVGGTHGTTGSHRWL